MLSLVAATRSSSTGWGTNNLPPLLFHNVHGENIRISRDATVARRVESFCKGIAFSARPVKVNEKICVKFLDISNNWSGVIRFGFTYNDPSTLRYGLPKYACPDLTNKPGYWAKALPERYCSQNTVLYYYVTTAGDVHFGINGEEKGIFFGGVETRGPLWALIDVYGNSTAIEFVDVRHQLNNSRRNAAAAVNPNSCDNVSEEIDRIVGPMNGLQIHQQRESEEPNVPVLRYQPPHVNYQPMHLHRTKGRNVRFNSNRSVATRVDAEFCQGYVFTGRPIQIGERVVIQILATEPMFQGCLSLGLTSCDPSTLQPSDLPDDSNFLLDRPEYWVISRNFVRNLNVGDEVAFYVAPSGEVHISKNGSQPSVIIHVDQTLKLWAFFDVYGSTRRIRLLSAMTAVVRNADRRIITPTSSESMNSLNSQSEMRRNSTVPHPHPQPQRVCLTPADVQVQPSANGGAVLSVILTPGHANFIGQQQQPVVVPSHGQQVQHPSHYPPGGGHVHSGQQHQHILAPVPLKLPLGISQNAPTTSGLTPTAAAPTGTMMSTCSSTYIEVSCGCKLMFGDISGTYLKSQVSLLLSMKHFVPLTQCTYFHASDVFLPILTYPISISSRFRFCNDQ